jgi:hypothetical protein
MPRKRRRRPIRIPVKQGSLSYISAILIRPLLKLRPETVSVSDWLNFLFCTHQRIIREYIVEESFSIPGKLRVLPQRNALNNKDGFRRVRKRSSIWVRVDTTVKNLVEVETNNARGGKTQLFELTTKQWKSVTPHLKLAPKRRAKRKIARYKPQRALSHLMRKPLAH